MIRQSLIRQCAAELLGTFILVLLGTGVVHVATLTGSGPGPWQVAAVWGAAAALAIYIAGAVSGAHLNPAITLAMAVYRKFPLRKVVPYGLSQLGGAIAAAALLYALYGGAIAQFEATHAVAGGQLIDRPANGALPAGAQPFVRGGPLSQRTAMAYGEYFPNPASSLGAKAVSPAQAMLAEGIGTALLALVVFAVTDRRRAGRRGGVLLAAIIGLALSIIIFIIAPLTQAGLNPARDFGPRLFAYFAGWGSVAIPGPRGGFFTVYILAPLLGAVAGGAIYHALVRPAAAKTREPAAPAKVGHEAT